MREAMSSFHCFFFNQGCDCRPFVHNRQHGDAREPGQGQSESDTPLDRKVPPPPHRASDVGRAGGSLERRILHCDLRPLSLLQLLRKPLSTHSLLLPPLLRCAKVLSARRRRVPPSNGPGASSPPKDLPRRLVPTFRM